MKIKDTKLGSFLKDKAPEVLGIVGDLLPDSGTIGIVKNILNAGSRSQSDKNEILASYGEMQKEYLKDVQNARDNETARDISENAGFLSKNIHEIIAIAVVGAWIFSWYIKPSITPDKIVDVVMLILGYLYGRTQPQK